MSYRLLLSALIIFSFEIAQANTLTQLVRSYPCSAGKNLGLYVFNMAGVETVVGYCDFETLRGYKSDQFAKTTPQDQVISKNCLDEDSADWVRRCYETYKIKCLETKKIRYGYSESVQTYIKKACINEQAAARPGAKPGQR